MDICERNGLAKLIGIVSLGSFERVQFVKLSYLMKRLNMDR